MVASLKPNSLSLSKAITVYKGVGSYLTDAGGKACDNWNETGDAVDALVRSRIDEQLCTIITTNHTPGQIESARPALAAALLEATYPVKIGGYNFRKIQGKEMTI